MKKRIARINAWSLAKLLFFADLLVLLIVAVPLGLFFHFINHLIAQNPSQIFFLPPPYTSLPIWPFFLVFLIHPFVLAVVGLFGANFYNFLARFLGGLEVTVEDAKSTQSPK